MHICFPTVDIAVQLDPLAPVLSAYQRAYQNLQHVDIPFHTWDNPWDTSNKYAQLMELGHQLGIELEPEPGNQDYFNGLHKLYETNYNGTHAWLEFHELIHVCELTGHDWFRRRVMHIDYREKAGLLQQPFDPAWISQGTTKLKRGDVFVLEAELGKMPYSYWRDHEPDSQDRLHELAKPWLILKPQLLVATEDLDLMANVDREGFDAWWRPREHSWCQKWNLKQWTVDHMFTAIRVAWIEPDPMDQLQQQLQAGLTPKRVRL